MRIDCFKQAREGEMAPRWYGIVRYDALTHTAFFLPIPINLIVRFVLVFYWKVVYFMYPSKFLVELEKARSAGWVDGRDYGFEVGKKEGHDEGYKAGYLAFGDFMVAELEKPASERYKD